MFWNPTYLNPLNDNMGNFATFQENANYYGLIQSGNLKPAIRIQRLLKIIAAKAGYSITSTFLGLSGDTQDKTTFFGKQFMTLAPQHERVRTKVYNGFLATMGTAITDGSVAIMIMPLCLQAYNLILNLMMIIIYLVTKLFILMQG